MAARPDSLFARLRRRLSATADTPDDALLDRFARLRDGDAFAALVGRHGPMVLGVCRRHLARPADAEDAFQAVFLVLVRDAGRLPPGVNLGGWLHAVAANLARQARRAEARRRGREARAARPDITEPSAGVGDLGAVLDEELARLPSAHRDAVVLCDLQGRTQDEAAGLLGRPRGTVAVHLARGRDRLRRRLAARGVTAAVAATVISVPDDLAAACVRAATTGTTTDAVRRLADGYRPGVFGMKAKLCAAAGVVLAVGLGLGVNWDGDRPADGPRAAAAPAPAPATTNAFLFGVSVPRKRDPREGPRMGIDAERVEWWLGDPDGSNLRLLDDPRTGRVKVRPVDRTVILGRDADGVTLLGPDGGDVFLSLKRGPLPKAEIHASGQRTTFAFTPDGKAVVFANKKGNLCRIDLAAQELTVSDVAGVNAADGVQFSPDGKRVAYSRYRRTDDRKPGLHGVCVAAADFTGEKLLTEASSISGFGFRPDGRVAVLDPRSVRAFDPETGKEEVVSGPWKNPVPARSFGGFNPDGSSFIFNTGGPYVLNLYAVDLKTTKITKVKDQYLESFQEMVWVRVPKGK